jgi:ELWxxDGT repeat protein
MSGFSRFTKRIGRRSDRRRGLAVESLESRNLLSLTARLAADINTIELGSSPRDFVTIGDALYFLADRGYDAATLWRYQPQAATVLTAIGSAKSAPTLLDGALYFSANPDWESPELWRYDPDHGASLATELVLNIDDERAVEPRDLTVFDGQLYFSARLDQTGRELWTLDGDTARLVTDINRQEPPSGYGWWSDSNPSELTVYNDLLYLIADDGIRGRAVWSFDGHAASLVAELPSEIYPTSLAVFDGQLNVLAHDGASSTQLWRYDGQQATLVGTVPILSANAKSVVFDNQLYFAALLPTVVPDAADNYALLRTDGTRFQQAPNVPSLRVADMAVFAGKLYFAADDQAAGSELWQYDGQTATRVTDINVFGDAVVSGFAVYGDELFFGATATHAQSAEVWRYDGATASRAFDIRPGNTSAFMSNLTVVDDTLHFHANNGVGHRGLWAFEGQDPSVASSSPLIMWDVSAASYAVAHSTTYFIAGSDFDTPALWRINNGVAEMISSDCFGGCTSVGPHVSVLALGDDVFFTAGTPLGEFVWKFDGQQ